MDIDELIARRLAALRKERELTLAQLAERCAVSKAMISRIERNQSSPTASVLGRLASGLGSPSPSCSATRRRRPNRSAGARSRCGKTRPAATAAARSALAIRAAAARWWKWRSRRTPASTIPAGAAGLPAAPVAGRGALRVDYGEQTFHLQRGDRLDFGVDRAVTFATAGQACRYLLVILHD